MAAAPEAVSAPPSAGAPNLGKRKARPKGKGSKNKARKKLARSDQDDSVHRRRNKPSAKFLKLLRKRARDYNSDDDEEEDEEQQKERPPRPRRRDDDGDDDEEALSHSDQEEDEEEEEGVSTSAVTRFEQGCRAFRVAFQKIMAKKLPDDPLGPILSAHKKLVAAKLAEEVEERKPKGEARKEKRVAAEKGHVIPIDHLNSKEKELIKVATKAVVRLFNAVSKAQKPRKDLNPSRTKDAKVLAKERKNTFLTELEMPSHQDKKSQAPSNFSKRTGKDDDEPAWAPLRDTYMLGSKLKDWDKMKILRENAEAPDGCVVNENLPVYLQLQGAENTDAWHEKPRKNKGEHPNHGHDNPCRLQRAAWELEAQPDMSELRHAPALNQDQISQIEERSSCELEAKPDMSEPGHAPPLMPDKGSQIEERFLSFLKGYEVNGHQLYKMIHKALATIGCGDMNINYKHLQQFDPILANTIHFFCDSVQTNLAKAAKVFLKEEVGFQCENPLVKICNRPMPRRSRFLDNLHEMRHGPKKLLQIILSNWSSATDWRLFLKDHLNAGVVQTCFAEIMQVLVTEVEQAKVFGETKDQESQPFECTLLGLLSFSRYIKKHGFKGSKEEQKVRKLSEVDLILSHFLEMLPEILKALIYDIDSEELKYNADHYDTFLVTFREIFEVYNTPEVVPYSYQ